MIAMYDEHDFSRPRLALWRFGWIWIVAGIIVSSYLSYAKFANTDLQCLDQGIFDCAAVQDSSWSTILGIPVSLIGLGTYLAIGLIWYFEQYNQFLKVNGRLLLFAIVLPAWAYSMWLVYVQLVILNALCQWCLTHEITISVLLATVIYQNWNDTLNDRE